jgi:tetratricopeptide (TPR) repeat protein
MSGKSTRLALTLIVAAAACQPAAAQVPDGPAIHRGAVDIYAGTQDVARAAAVLQQFKPQDFERAMAALIATKDAARIRVTATFHLEIAIALAGLSPGTAKLHVDLGRDLLEETAKLRKAGMRVDGLDEFRSIWLSVAGSVFLSVRDPQHSMSYLREALDLAPKSAHVLTVVGSAEEVDASGWNTDDWSTLSQRERTFRERNARLGRAEKAYRDALRIDPGYALASIRLGRVLQLNGKLDEAREAMDRGMKDSRGPFSEYVGSLFLGSLLVDQKDLAGARRAYARALAIAPFSQPAVVGMAHVELMSGRPDRAQALAQGFAANNTIDTWWAYKDGSLDLPGLAWLRDRVKP